MAALLCISSGFGSFQPPLPPPQFVVFEVLLQALVCLQKRSFLAEAGKEKGEKKRGKERREETQEQFVPPAQQATDSKQKCYRFKQNVIKAK